jgi:hypothetical protein
MTARPARRRSPTDSKNPSTPTTPGSGSDTARPKANPNEAGGRAANRSYLQLLQIIAEWEERKSLLFRTGTPLGDALLAAEAKRRFPKARNPLQKLTRDDVDVILKPLRDEYVPAMDEVTLLINAYHESQARLLGDIELEKLDDRMELVDTSHPSTYRTQTNASGYARGELMPLEWKLKSLGYDVHVRALPATSTTMPRFELWANLPAWQKQAVEVRITEREAVKSRGVLNPRVYNPWFNGEWP